MIVMSEYIPLMKSDVMTITEKERTNLVSIIIPVYNTEKYMRRCLESILSQTSTDFEVILVDDGSPDRSGEICDEYAEKDNRIKVIHNRNYGVSHSRNAGINIAQGEWIMFVDSDDELSPDCFQKLSLGMVDKNDMIIGGYDLIDEKGYLLTQNSRNDVLSWDMKTCLRDVYRSQHASYNGFCANRLFRRSIIQEQRLFFVEDIFSREDGLFLVQYLLRCSGLCYYTLSSVYKYRQHGNNATSSFKKSYNPKIITGIDSHLLCINEIKKYSEDDVLLKYAQKGLINSFRWNLTQLIKFHKWDFNYYFILFRKLFKGVGMFRYVQLILDDKLPVLLHPLTALYRKSNLKFSFFDNYMQKY